MIVCASKIRADKIMVCNMYKLTPCFSNSNKTISSLLQHVASSCVMLLFTSIFPFYLQLLIPHVLFVKLKDHLLPG